MFKEKFNGVLIMIHITLLVPTTPNMISIEKDEEVVLVERYQHETNLFDDTAVDSYQGDLLQNTTEFFIEDDMILNKEQNDGLRKPDGSIKKRAGVMSAQFRWPNGIVPYKLDVRLKPIDIAVIDDAMTHIESASCVRFIPAKSDDIFLKIELGDWCSSWVGRQGLPQPMTVARKCLKMGTVAHELMHSLGFYHEHGSSERDNYIWIFKENITKDKTKQFEKYSGDFTLNFNVPYDYESIMHYSPFAFTSNGKPTIMPLESGVELGQRKALSEGDFLKLNRMYECSEYLK